MSDSPSVSGSPETIAFGSCETCGAPSQIIAHDAGAWPWNEYRYVSPLEGKGLTPEEAGAIIDGLFGEGKPQDDAAYVRGFAKLRGIANAE